MLCQHCCPYLQIYDLSVCAMMQISTAERRGVPHHLLDILSPREEFSAGDFYERARTATADILQVLDPAHTEAHILHPTCHVYLHLSLRPCVLTMRCLQNSSALMRPLALPHKDSYGCQCHQDHSIQAQRKSARRFGYLSIGLY